MKKSNKSYKQEISRARAAALSLQMHIRQEQQMSHQLREIIKKKNKTMCEAATETNALRAQLAELKSEVELCARRIFELEKHRDISMIVIERRDNRINRMDKFNCQLVRMVLALKKRILEHIVRDWEATNLISILTVQRRVLFTNEPGVLSLRNTLTSVNLDVPKKFAEPMPSKEIDIAELPAYPDEDVRSRKNTLKLAEEALPPDPDANLGETDEERSKREDAEVQQAAILSAE